MNGHRAKVLTKDSLFLVSKLHLREFLDPGFTILLLVFNTAQKPAMCSDTNLNLCSLFISLMNLWEHMYRNSTRVRNRPFFCNISLVYDFEALYRIYCISSLENTQLYSDSSNLHSGTTTPRRRSSIGVAVRTSLTRIGCFLLTGPLWF